MNINKIALLMSMMASYAAAMDTDNDVPTIKEIESTLLGINNHCGQKCTVLKDALSACTAQCILDTSSLLDGYLVRQYTRSCLGIATDEAFKYDPILEEKGLALQEKLHVQDEWDKDPNVKACAQRKIDITLSRLKFTQNKSNKTISDFREKNPVIAKLVDAEHKIRRLDEKRN